MVSSIASVVAAAEPAGDFEALLRGFLAGLEHAADARSVDGERLLHEHVAAFGHGIFHVDRPKGGRRGQEHDAAGADRIDRLLVAIEAGELAVRRDIDLFGQPTAAQPLDAALPRFFSKKSAAAKSFVGPAVCKAFVDRPVTAATAAHQGDLDRVILAGIGPLRDGAGQCDPGQRSAGLLKELATCRSIVGHDWTPG